MVPSVNKGHFQKVFYMFPLLAFVFLSYAMVIETQNVAVTHDELWDYYPAVGMMNAESLVPPQELSVFGFPLPLVTGPYQGALKTWLVAPVLKVLGTSVYVLRGINVFLGLFYLWCLYWALSAVIPRQISLAVFLVPFLDPNFLVYAPMDYGPFLTQVIFITLAIGCLGRYMAKSDPAYLSYGFLALGLTLAQKLTALPVVIAYFAATLLFIRTAVPGLLKGKRPFLLLALIVVPLIPHLIYFGKHGFGDLLAMTHADRNLPYFEKLRADLLFFVNSLNGVGWVRRLTGKALDPTPLPVLGYAGTIIIIIAAMLSLGKDRKDMGKRLGGMYLFLLLTGFIAYAFFKGLDRPWHYHILHPLFILATFHSAYLIGTAGLKRYSKSLVYGASGILLCAMLVPGVKTGLQLLDLQEREKGSVINSLGLYQLERELEMRGAKNVLCLNYSLGNPLYVLSGGRLKTYDLTWMEKSDALLYSILKDTYYTKDTYIVYRHSSNKEADQDWIKWLNQGSTFMFDRLPKLDVPSTLRSLRFQDGRETEFGLLFF